LTRLAHASATSIVGMRPFHVNACKHLSKHGDKAEDARRFNMEDGSSG
jgi:hypothetical protein